MPISPEIDALKIAEVILPLAIETITTEDETVLVPGKVLGSGTLDHKVQVAALDFSQKAEDKIASAGGKCLDINLLLEENPTGSGVKIIQ